MNKNAPTISDVYDSERGCGWRKPGGLYLCSDNLGRACARMPIPLTVCPCCNAGIKPSRGWTWIDVNSFLKSIPECPEKGSSFCNTCGITHMQNELNTTNKAGLLWVGGKYYKTPESFNFEASVQGVSRRINSVPRDFVLGETWVWLAHRECIPNPDPQGKPTPGVFHIFKPQRIEYVVKRDESPEKLESLEKRGITLVNVIKVGDD